MGAGVDHRVPGAVVGEVSALARRIKGVDQHLHAGQAAVCDEVEGVSVQIPQILSDQGQAGDGAQGLHQLHAGAGLPVAAPGVGRPVGDAPVGVEGPEVVDAYHVVQPGQVGGPVPPPGEAGLPVIVPVVQGIAPVLPLVGEGVGWNSCHTGRSHVLLELK